LSLARVKLHEIKNLEIIMGAIKRNWKNINSIKIYQSQIKNPKQRFIKLSEENMSGTSSARLIFVLPILASVFVTENLHFFFILIERKKN
jgi:hypothetical protein